jgi:ATP-dependent Zn protease
MALHIRRLLPNNSLQVSLDYEDDGRSMSSETRQLVEEEVRRLVQGAYDRARSILMANLGELHALADELLDKETLSGDQIRVIMGQVRSMGCVFVYSSCTGGTEDAQRGPDPRHHGPGERERRMIIQDF